MIVMSGENVGIGQVSQNKPLSLPLIPHLLILFTLFRLLELGTSTHEESIFWDGWNFFRTYCRCNHLFLFFHFRTFYLCPTNAQQLE